jgi:hypothetical protein
MEVALAVQTNPTAVRRASHRLIPILTGFVSVGSLAMLVVLGTAIRTAIG